MRNCPNCGAPIEPYKNKCQYCGIYYFDFTSFDMTGNIPYYIKFKTPMGEITTLAKPELNTIELSNDYLYANDNIRICESRTCDFQVTFHTQLDKQTNTLFILKADT